MKPTQESLLKPGDMVGLNRDGTIYRVGILEGSPALIGIVLRVINDVEADVQITTNDHKHVQRFKIGSDTYTCACGAPIDPSKAWFGSKCRMCEFLSML